MIKLRSIIFYYKRSGFTLIELLVVVTVVGMLISLVLPAIGKARETGRRAACVNNLRQIYIAFALYLDDNNNKIFWGTPQQATIAVIPEADCMDWFVYGGRPTGNLYTGQGGLFNMTTWTNGIVVREIRPLNKYLDNRYELFKCPSDRGRPDWPFPGKITPLYEAVGNSYNLNCYGPNSTQNGGVLGYDISSIRTPSRTILFHCETAFPDLTQDWHSKGRGGNACFIDGHIKFMVIESTDVSGADKYGTPYSWGS